MTDVEFRNDCPFTVSVAIRHYVPECGIEGASGPIKEGASGPINPWKVEGWWNIAPGQTVFPISTPEPIFYYYAEGGGHTWSGSTGVYVRQKVFEICFQPTPPDSSWRLVGMRQIDCNGYSTFTLPLYL